MHELSFVIPIRVDTPDRLENCGAILRFLTAHFPESEIQLIEQDVESQTGRLRDAFPQVVERLFFQCQVCIQYLFDGFANPDRVEPLDVRQPVEEKDTLDQFICMLHLVNRFGIFLLPELRYPPVLQRTRVQEILIDRGQLVFQDCVEML